MKRLSVLIQLLILVVLAPLTLAVAEDSAPSLQSEVPATSMPGQQADGVISVAPSPSPAEVSPVQDTANANKLISLQTRVFALEKQLAVLREANLRLKDRSDREWFVIGAAAVLAGMMIGLIVPKIQWRRKSWHKL